MRAAGPEQHPEGAQPQPERPCWASSPYLFLTDSLITSGGKSFILISFLDVGPGHGLANR